MNARLQLCQTLLFGQGNLTGIAYAEIQTQPSAQGSRILAAQSCQQVVQLLGAALAIPKRHKP